MSNAGKMMTNEEAIKILKNLMAMKNISFLHFSQRLAIGIAIKALKEQPERKKGKWEQQTEPLGAYEVECAVCSVCNECFDLGEEYSIEDIRKLFAYCPNCGAHMIGDRIK